MKKVISILLCVALMTTNSVAQKTTTKPKPTASTQRAGGNNASVAKPKYINTKIDTAITTMMALEVCKCMSPKLDSLHPLIFDLLENTAKKGEKEAQELFTEALVKLSPESQKKLMADIEKLDSDGPDSIFGNDDCMKALDDKFEKIDMDDKPGREKAIEKLFMNMMKQSCPKAGTIMELGMMTKKG